MFADAAANGYNGALVGGGENPLAGQSAFVGSSRGYVSSRANLLALAGQSVRFRFRMGEDEVGGTDYGWFIDDVRLYTCSPEPVNPSVEVTLTADEPMVTVGDDIHLHTTVHNDGNVLITGAEVSVAGLHRAPRRPGGGGHGRRRLRVHHRRPRRPRDLVGYGHGERRPVRRRRRARTRWPSRCSLPGRRR